MATPTQHIDRALLIGVDNYQYIWPLLNGCVGDVNGLEQALVTHLQTPPGQIVKLTAGQDGQEKPEELATRDNIIKALKRLAAETQEGEQIYIHYSGHGMRNDTTILPGYEPDGRDEAIAPTDTGYQDPANYYILDKELGWLIRQITDKGAFVTVVLDCCHSASGTRLAEVVKVRRGQRRPEDGAGERGWEGGDPRPRPDSTLVAPLAELKAVVSAEGGAGSLLPAPKNYVLLTACREQETAKEYHSNGVFTYYFLQLLQKGITGLTYRTLQDQVAGSILQLASSDPNYTEQTPQLEGNGHLILFGGGVTAQPYALGAVRQADGTLLLTGGAAVGLTVGSTIALYPPGAINLDDPNGQLALATVTRVQPDASIARVADGVSVDTLVPGMQAVVVRPGVAKVRRRIAIGDGPGLDELKQAIAQGGRDGAGSPYIEAVAPGDRQEFSVVVDRGFYSILDQRDQSLPRITPPLVVGQSPAVRQMVQRLEHVVQYRNFWELHNEDESSGLRGKLAVSVELVGSAGRGAGRIALRPGDIIRIRVHNHAGKPLSAALLYFAPDWSVSRIWPDGPSPAYTELASTDDGFAVYEMEAALPTGITHSVERLKLFATEKPTSFDVLTLGSLDVARQITRSVGGDALENLLADIGEGQNTRELVRRTGTGDWGTAECELETSV